MLNLADCTELLRYAWFLGGLPAWGWAGSKEMQVRAVVRGSASVLGDAASEWELFLTEDLAVKCAPPLVVS